MALALCGPLPDGGGGMDARPLYAWRVSNVEDPAYIIPESCRFLLFVANYQRVPLFSSEPQRCTPVFP